MKVKVIASREQLAGIGISVDLIGLTGEAQPAGHADFLKVDIPLSQINPNFDKVPFPVEWFMPESFTEKIEEDDSTGNR